MLPSPAVTRSGNTFITIAGTRAETLPRRPMNGTPITVSASPLIRRQYSAPSAVNRSGQGWPIAAAARCRRSRRAGAIDCTWRSASGAAAASPACRPVAAGTSAISSRQ
ncbi:hypothetical protein D3C71_1401080 [compost metagenome]